MFGAWQHERFTRTERLRPFNHYAKQLAKPARAPRAQTVDERIAEIRAHRGLGGATTFRRL
jgi:hypothetical protein